MKICNTTFSRTIGLMFRIKPQSAILVLPKESKTLASIHMLFVFFPLDIVWLDKNKKVVDIKRNVRPFTINHTPKKPAKYVVEFPIGQTKGLELGQVFPI